MSTITETNLAETNLAETNIADAEMNLGATDLDDDKQSVADSEEAPNASDTEEDSFVPKEPEESAWPAEWPKDWVKPSFAELEATLAAYKKAHKNSLPTEKELPELVFGTPSSMDDEQAALLYKLLLGVKNSDGKLDQQGQKGSMRSKWKEQFPKSKRSPEALGFKLYADEAMLVVEEQYVPLFESYVEKLSAQASKIDKGHAPTALVKQAHDQLKRLKDARDARKTRVETAQQKRRDAEVAKARAKEAKKEAKKAEVKKDKPTKTDAEARVDVEEYAKKMEAKVTELRESGLPLGDCFKRAREELAGA